MTQIRTNKTKKSEVFIWVVGLRPTTSANPNLAGRSPARQKTNNHSQNSFSFILFAYSWFIARHGVAELGKNGQTLAENGRKWQNGTVWYSWNQVQVVQYTAGEGVTKNEC